MNLNKKDFLIEKHEEKFYIVCSDNKRILQLPKIFGGFNSELAADDWLNDFIASYNSTYGDSDLKFEDFCSYFTDSSKSNKDILTDILKKGLLKSTDTYGNVIASKLADYIFNHKALFKHIFIEY